MIFAYTFSLSLIGFYRFVMVAIRFVHVWLCFMRFCIYESHASLLADFLIQLTQQQYTPASQVHLISKNRILSNVNLVYFPSFCWLVLVKGSFQCVSSRPKGHAPPTVTQSVCCSADYVYKVTQDRGRILFFQLCHFFGQS